MMFRSDKVLFKVYTLESKMYFDNLVVQYSQSVSTKYWVLTVAIVNWIFSVCAQSSNYKHHLRIENDKSISLVMHLHTCSSTKSKDESVLWAVKIVFCTKFIC